MDMLIVNNLSFNDWAQPISLNIIKNTIITIDGTSTSGLAQVDPADRCLIGSFFEGFNSLQPV
jgi:hypothetical protein